MQNIVIRNDNTRQNVKCNEKGGNPVFFVRFHNIHVYYKMRCLGGKTPAGPEKYREHGNSVPRKTDIWQEGRSLSNEEQGI